MVNHRLNALRNNVDYTSQASRSHGCFVGSSIRFEGSLKQLFLSMQYLLLTQEPHQAFKTLTQLNLDKHAQLFEGDV